MNVRTNIVVACKCTRRYMESHDNQFNRIFLMTIRNVSVLGLLSGWLNIYMWVESNSVYPDYKLDYFHFRLHSKNLTLDGCRLTGYNKMNFSLVRAFDYIFLHYKCYNCYRYIGKHFGNDYRCSVVPHMQWIWFVFCYCKLVSRWALSFVYSELLLYSWITTGCYDARFLSGHFTSFLKKIFFVHQLFKFTSVAGIFIFGI